jgi:hypothetical protein
MPAWKYLTHRPDRRVHPLRAWQIITARKPDMLATTSQWHLDQQDDHNNLQSGVI